MKSNDALTALNALAQEHRLAVFRYLVTQGRQGALPSAMALRLDMAKPTLSFHLKELKAAGLVSCERAGRALIYRANLDAMNDLVAYLTENCCAADQATCGSSAAICNP